MRIRIETHQADADAGRFGPGWYWQPLNADTGETLMFPQGPHASKGIARSEARRWVANQAAEGSTT